MKLTIELVPKTSWYSNVRSNVEKTEWDIIRQKCYKAANYKCEICNGIGKNHSVECHEIWQYNNTTHVQKLTGFIALCPRCHECKHIGLAHIKGNFDRAIRKIAGVNYPEEEKRIYLARGLVEMAFEVWRERSKHQWELDINFVNDYIIDHLIENMPSEADNYDLKDMGDRLNINYYD